MSRLIPKTPSGTLELSPPQQILFQNMLDTIRRIYELYGFIPIETPLFEKKNLLLKNSNQETQKQAYLIQSTGAWQQQSTPDLVLRFDLTVPLARYVAQNERLLSFPFRRYQIQRVYRGERPQKGRFREFYQCDIDIITKNHLTLSYDAEIITVITHLLQALKLGSFTIHLNHRLLLYGLLELFQVTNLQHQYALLQALDKSHKVEPTTTHNTIFHILQHAQPNTPPSHLLKTTEQFFTLFHRKDSPSVLLESLLRSPFETPSIQQALHEIQTLLRYLKAFGVSEDYLCLDLCIVRGLDYYTGIVYETFLNSYPQLGSIGSGGRYENLTQNYTKSHLPGVGLSLGITRLFAYLLDEGLFQTEHSLPSVLVTNIDPNLQTRYIHLAKQLRTSGINTLFYHETTKLSKQLKYAQQCHIPWAIIIGSQEQAAGMITVKSLETQQQYTFSLEKFLSILSLFQESNSLLDIQHQQQINVTKKFFSLLQTTT